MLGISPGKQGGKSTESSESKRMTDVALANDLIEEIAGTRHVGQMFRVAYKELSKRFPHKQDPENRWTERRLRSWWHNESKTVRYSQMCELYETAESVRRAREAHAEYKQKTAHLRQMAELRKAGSHRDLA